MKASWCFLAVLVIMALLPDFDSIAADQKPVAGITAFGGAERLRGEDAGTTGGTKLFGLLPVGKTVGLQGDFHVSGGQHFRLGLNAGPVLTFGSGIAGLFLDYEWNKNLDLSATPGRFSVFNFNPRFRDDYHLIAIRGAGGFYFDRFDALASYSQPISSVKRSNGHKIAGINELQGTLRFYPTSEIELSGGFLVNSFAGPGNDDRGGTGVGGIFSISFKLFDPVVIQLAQAKFDNHNRYRVTSGIQLIFGSPLKDWLRAHWSSAPAGAPAGDAKIIDTRRLCAPADLLCKTK